SRFHIDSKSLNKVSAIVVLDLSKVANPLFSLRDKDLFKLKDPQLVVAATKLPILNPNEFDLWKMRIEQYFLMTDYSLWEEDINLKFLRSLPSEWKTHTLIWRNKVVLMEQSLDDLFNNLKIYKAEVNGSSTSSQNTQNIAFVSSNNTDSTNTSKASISTLPNVDNLSDAVIYSFFASHSNSPQLDNEDLKQIDPDDLEEMDLKWHMAMLTMRAGRFLQRTGRNLGANRTDTIGFDMSKVKCYNCHRKGLESAEARLVVYQKNKNVFKEEIKLLKLDVMLRDNALVELKKKFEKAKKERDDLKLTLEKIQTSSKNLSKLLESQVSDKAGLGFDSQVFNSQVFDCEEEHSLESENSVPKSLVNDRYKTGEGYHVVSPPYTGTFMPSKPDLVFNDAPTASESIAHVVNVESSSNKSSKDMSKTLRPDASIIEDSISDFEDETKIESVSK
nr:hypothetical protein [Tanacetum cinerariifolium]